MSEINICQCDVTFTHSHKSISKGSVGTIVGAQIIEATSITPGIWELFSGDAPDVPEIAFEMPPRRTIAIPAFFQAFTRSAIAATSARRHPALIPLVPGTADTPSRRRFALRDIKNGRNQNASPGN